MKTPFQWAMQAAISVACAGLFIGCVSQIISGEPGAEAQSSFTNPVFTNQDPWVVFVNGVYYYSESDCNNSGPTICIRHSTSLTGLGTATPTVVWTAPSSGPNSNDVWAPQLQYINGNWYIYYAADNQGDNNHRLFVLQPSTPGNILGSWTWLNGQGQSSTGAVNGELAENLSNPWAIDPDVFFGTDNNLYIVFSCRYNTSNNYQGVCLNEMSDPTHLTGNAVQLSAPIQQWEQRYYPTEEGPVGFTSNGVNYITYSAGSSVWYDGYSVGLLVNNGPPQPNGTGDALLNPGSWRKVGPIFDGHHTSWGTGSVVFVPSPDGKETWNVYHGIDCENCSWANRSIRMQKMYWDEEGFPVLGYPVDILDTKDSLGEAVPLDVPSGENGYTGTGSTLVPWGAAYGDAVEGDTTDGLPSGNWSYSNASTITLDSTDPGRYDQEFAGANPNYQTYTVTTNVQLLKTGTGDPYPKYGIYAAYVDHNNYVAGMLDVTVCTAPGCLAVQSVVNGQSNWKNCTLPAGFNGANVNNLTVEVTNGYYDNTYTWFVNGQMLAGSCQNQQFFLDYGQWPGSQKGFSNGSNGQVGVVTENTEAAYTNFNVSPGVPQDGQTYMFLNQASQMRLDNDCDGCSGAATNGVQVIQYPGNGWETQEWTLHSQGNGYFTMVSVQSGLCLDDPWGNGTPSRALPQQNGTSTMLWQQPCNGQAPQNWLFLPQGNGYYVIENQGATQNSGEPGTPLVIDDYYGEQTQGLQMWLDYANGLSPQNWLLIVQ